MENEKLVRVERFIEINKKGTSEVKQEINVDHITLEQLLDIFEPYERGDPLLYDPYSIDEEKLKRLNFYLQTPISYEESKHDYILACFGIYEDIITGNTVG